MLRSLYLDLKKINISLVISRQVDHGGVSNCNPTLAVYFIYLVLHILPNSAFLKCFVNLQIEIYNLPTLVLLI